jgi:hypothetical protein
LTSSSVFRAPYGKSVGHKALDEECERKEVYVMRRTKIVLAVAALLAAMLAAIPGPAAMADTERCNVHDNNFVTCQ